jgi:porin
MTRRALLLFASLCGSSFAASQITEPAQQRLNIDALQQVEITDDQEYPHKNSPLFDPSEYGMSFSGVIKSDYWNVISGGVQNGSKSLLNVDLTASVDLDHLAGWTDTEFFIHFLGNNGGSISSHVGDMQMVSNIEAYRTFKLYQCWFEQSFPSVGISFLVGILDLNAEFYATPSSSLFLNGSHGVGIDLSQSGLNGPSIFPNTSLAVRMRYSPNSTVSFSAAVFDGRPGAVDDCDRFGLTLSNSEGYFLISELEYRPLDNGKIGVGAWLYSGEFADMCGELMPGTEMQRSDNFGMYLLADVPLYREGSEDQQGLSVFSRAGVSNEHLNLVRFHYGGGMTYTGLIDGRDDDQIGYAVAFASFGSDFIALNSFYGTPVNSYELVHEFTYRGPVTSWLTLQGNVQYIVHPSASTEIQNAFVAGIRLEIAL